jgi:TonB family protein
MKEHLVVLGTFLAFVAFGGCEEQKAPGEKQAQVTSPSLSETEPGINEVINVDEFPSIVKRVNPVYPEEAMKNGIEGTVLIKVLVGKDGTVKKAVATEGKEKNESFERAAIDAVKQFTFTPALIKHQPVEIWVSIPFKFKLAEKK